MSNPSFYRTLLSIGVLLASVWTIGTSQSNDRDNVPIVLRPDVVETRQRIPNLVPTRDVRRPKIALVFSGGGARGLSSIGVLKAFEAQNVPIDYLIGTSIGSIVAGLYAAGYSTQQLEEIVRTTDWADVLSYSDESQRRDLFLDQKLAKDKSSLIFRFSGFEPVFPASLSSAQRLTNFLNILTLQGIFHPNPSFDNLRIPFRAVTTDLVSGKRVVLHEGDLAEALRAAVTVPLLFSPVVKDTMQLMDGGLVSNIPVDVGRQLGADIVIAIDATSPLRNADQLSAPWEVAEQIVGIMMLSANADQMKLADVVIRPAIGNHLSADFTGLDSLVRKGEEAASEMMPAIQRFIREKQKSGSFDTAAGRSFPRPKIEFADGALDGEWSKVFSSLGNRETITEQEMITLLNDLYGTGNYASVEMEVLEQGTMTHLRLNTRQYPVFRDVRFMGNRNIPSDTLRQVFEPLLGRRLNSHESRKAMEEMLGMYRDRGFSLARIRNAQLDQTSGVAAITIDEGIVYRREVVGTRKTRDYVIWREMPLQEREEFTVAKASRSITNLYSTGLFDQVLLGVYQTVEEGEERHILRVMVRERPTELIRVSLRVDNERGVQPSIDIRDENFLGIGSELGVTAHGGLRNRSYVAEFKATRIFNTYLTFSLKGYYRLYDAHVFADERLTDPAHWKRVRMGEFREVKQGGSAAFGTQLERLGTVTVEGRLENHRYWSIFNRPVQPDEYNIASIKVGTRLDSQDDFPFPTDGISMNFFYESAFVRVKDGISFSKFFFDYGSHRSIAKGHVLHPRIVFGSADRTLPFTEQFSIGGQGNFLGLREDNARGRQLFVASLEYRYHSPVKLFFDTYFKLRYDFGTIWEGPDQIRLKDLRHGVGFGMAFDTPLGPAEFTVGQSFYFRKELLDNPLSRGPVIVYFSIGYSL